AEAAEEPAEAEATEEEASEPPPPAEPPAPGGGDPPDPPGTVSLARAARERYLNYALSVITARALPDVRDGLKPVQRRILYAMYANLRLTPQGRFRKSAAVVGAVMASYHPHGDQSIYDAMVRLAQSFSLRAPLVEGHGNFGSLDGDPPAAMRYTESRLRGLALEMVSEIDRDTVAFRDNYDGTTQEPVVLPARIPQLLVNGSTGIAVGMATNIPPHNLREVCQAAVALIDDPELTTPGLMEYVEGPDFPIGGEILNSRDELLNIYATGRGPVRLRATWHEEKANRRRYIVVTSVPWGRNKASLIEKVGELIRDGHVPQLTDVRDESTDDIRVVLELKRRAVPEVAMAYLFRHTDLQINVHVNMTVLLPTANPEIGTPAQVGLRTLLRQFLDFRLVVVRRRFEYDLRKLEKRIHILEGYEIVFDALDEAIALIRESDGKKDAASRLVARFGLSDEQTEAILELKLYRLARLEIHVIRKELAEKRAAAERIRAILASEEALWGEVRSELLEVASLHGDARRSKIVGPSVELEFDPDAYIVDEDTWVIVTRKGWLKRQKGFSELEAIRVREGDAVGWAMQVSTRSTVTFYSDNGRAYVIRAKDVPATTGYGEPIQRRFALADGATIVGVVPNDPRLASPYEHVLPLEIFEGPEGEGVEDSLDPDATMGEIALPADGDGDDSPTEDAAGMDVKAPAPEPTEPAAPEAAPEAAPDGEPGAEPTAAAAATAENVGPVAVAITQAGKGLLFPLSSHSEPSTKNGRKYVSLSSRGKDGVVAVRVLQNPDARVFLATHSGRVIIFRVDTLKFLKGTGKGVNAIRIAKNDRVIDFALGAGARDSLAVVTSRGRDVNVSERKYGMVSRGGKGFEVIKRGTLKSVPPEAQVLAPAVEEEGEDIDELDAIADELEDALAAEDDGSGESSEGSEGSEGSVADEETSADAPEGADEEPDAPQTEEGAGE
ncbi:MAG: DNA topoisomerase IV subunit A, partial [Deltaproteobacteria bacterium]|nr:DNA topoisomerase IV subunit A [Deltaproteobacteria bacterium]